MATGQNSILMDLNTFVWVSKKEIGFLGGAVFSASATLPVANNSLTSDIQGSISGGGGFADSYYQPVILGWRKQRVAVRAIYGFLAPTGRFSAGANTNVGSGYWTNVVASGQTIYLDSAKATALSAFQMYEFHGTQEGTMVHPGQTLNLDYSLTHSFPVSLGCAFSLDWWAMASGRLPLRMAQTSRRNRRPRATSQRFGVCSKRTIAGAEG